MIIFYKTPIQAISGQFINQSFNSTVNYCNAPTPKFVPQDFLLAAGSACAAAYTYVHQGFLQSAFRNRRCLVVIQVFRMNKMASRPSVPKVVARLVPFGAVAVANCINLVSNLSY